MNFKKVINSVIILTILINTSSYSFNVSATAVKQAKVIATMVEYGNKTCAYCVKEKQVLTQIQKKYGNRIVFKYVDLAAKESKGLIKKYNIKGVPYVMILNSKNQQVDKFTGYRSQKEVEAILRKNKFIK